MALVHKLIEFFAPVTVLAPKKSGTGTIEGVNEDGTMQIRADDPNGTLHANVPVVKPGEAHPTGSSAFAVVETTEVEDPPADPPPADSPEGEGA